MGKTIETITTYTCDFCGQTVDVPCHELDITMESGMDARDYLIVKIEPHMNYHPNEASLVVCRNCVRRALAKEFGLEVNGGE